MGSANVIVTNCVVVADACETVTAKAVMTTNNKMSRRISILLLELSGRPSAPHVHPAGLARGRFGIVQPVPGHQLRLSLDLDVQRAGQQAISGDEGAFVVMDVHTGAIVLRATLPYLPEGA